MVVDGSRVSGVNEVNALDNVGFCLSSASLKKVVIQFI